MLRISPVTAINSSNKVHVRLAVCRPNLGVPLPYRSIGINDLAEKLQIIHGLQPLAGKILSGKELGGKIWDFGSGNSLALPVAAIGGLGSAVKVRGKVWMVEEEVEIPTSRKGREKWGTL